MKLIQIKSFEGRATVTLNRPQVHNALNSQLIAELICELQELDLDTSVRTVVIGGAGKSFCAGADLEALRASASLSLEENIADANKLAALLRALNELSKPTIARVHGPAYGGGLGLIACCDIAIAASDALFSFSEVRLGIVPAVISPYIIAAIGERQARRYLLSAERFDAQEAKRIGLVHEVVKAEALDSTEERICARIIEGGPSAVRKTKALIRRPGDDPAKINAEARASAEAKEGIAAFFEKRKPRW
ncbi:MAG: enoyl-CoA hydratase-related protein [Burkholderiales bacterium]